MNSVIVLQLYRRSCRHEMKLYDCVMGIVDVCRARHKTELRAVTPMNSGGRRDRHGDDMLN